MFEIHVTVDSSNIESFKKDCNEIGCKPVLIELDCKEQKLEQLMTSQKFRGRNWKNEVNNIRNKLINKKYNISRIKVEINPQILFEESIKYLESHIRVKINNNQEEILSLLCSKLNFHKSKNKFKKIDKDNYYLMCTYRTYDLNLEKFNFIVNEFKQNLDKFYIKYDKIEIEGCILDTNETLDKNWI